MADPQPTEPAAPLPKPKGTWGMILTATPVALTALATAFAGLSTSEMTQAMYHRSLAAQHQSRAGDQWAFFQAKRIRGNGLESSGEVLQALGHPEPFFGALIESLGQLESSLAQLRKGPAGDEATQAVAAAKKVVERFRALPYGTIPDGTSPGPLPTSPLPDPFNLPPATTTPLPDPGARQAYEEAVSAIAKRKPETETTTLVAGLSPETIDEAIRLAEDDADRFDQACEPGNKEVGHLKALLKQLADAIRPLRGKTGPAGEAVAAFDRLDASFRAAAMDYEARRYRQEAAFNRRAAEAYEVRVRRSGVESDRHRERSKRFFYSMLLAQVGVTVASLALARAQRSLLWLLAAAAGVVALVFTGYVYLSY